jgi:hypothetical protein
MPEPRPIKARRPRASVEEEEEGDMEMKDVRKDKKGKKESRNEMMIGDQSGQKKKDEASNKIAGRQSELTAKVDKQKVVNRILDLQIPMSLRELMVTSKEIRLDIQDLIKVRNV